MLNSQIYKTEIVKSRFSSGKTKLLLIAAVLLHISFLCSGQNSQKAAGSPGLDMDKAIILHDTTGFLVVGIADTTSNKLRVWLIHLDNNGDTVWTKIFDSGVPGGLAGVSIAHTSDSGIVMGATVQGFNGTHQDALIIKTDGMGNFQWAKTIEDSVNQSMFYNPLVCESSNGNIVAACVDQGATSSVIAVAMLDINGNIVWAEKIHTAGTVNYVTDVVATPLGFLIYGYTNVNGNLHEFRISLGLLGYIVDYFDVGGSTGSSYSTGIIPITSGGSPDGYLLTGYTNSFGAGNYDGFVVKTDLSFVPQWSKTYGGLDDDRIYTCKQVSDNKFIFGGITKSFGAGGYDGLLFSTDALGNPLAARAYGGAMDDYVYGVAIDNSNNLVAVGGTKSYGSGMTDAWSITLGQVVSHFRLSDINTLCNEDTISLTVTSPTVVTNTAVTVTIDSSGLVFTPRTLYTSSGGTITNICSTVGIDEPASLNSATIFPNPSSGMFTLTFNQPVSNCSLKIFNTLGEQVYSEEIIADNLNKNSKEIHLNVSPGIYFAQLSDENVQSTYKIVLY